MIDYTIDSRQSAYLIEFENSMLDRIIANSSQIRDEIEKKGFNLVIELGWTNWIKHRWSKTRMPFQNGYMCYIYYSIQKNGQFVALRSDDGEAEHYLLLSSTNISSISRRLFRLEVGICSDEVEIQQRIEELKLQLDDKEDLCLISND